MAKFLQPFAHVLSHYQVTNVGVVLEMQLPLTSKRLDCLMTGADESSHPSAVIIELKQWGDAEPSSISDCVVAFVGQAPRDMLHPSQQAVQYKRAPPRLWSCRSAGTTASMFTRYKITSDADVAPALLRTQDYRRDREEKRPVVSKAGGDLK